MRFILRQHSPDWRAFSLEEISVYRESVVTTSTLGQADRGRGVRTAAAASRSAPWTDPARPPAGPRAAVARREDKANKLEHSAPRTCNTEKETRGHRGWLLQTGLCGLWVAPGHSRGLQVVPQDTQGTPGDPRGPQCPRVSATLTLYSWSSPVSSLSRISAAVGIQGTLGDTPGVPGGPQGTPGVLSVQGVP